MSDTQPPSPNRINGQLKIPLVVYILIIGGVFWNAYELRQLRQQPVIPPPPVVCKVEGSAFKLDVKVSPESEKALGEINQAQKDMVVGQKVIGTALSDLITKLAPKQECPKQECPKQECPKLTCPTISATTDKQLEKLVRIDRRYVCLMYNLNKVNVPKFCSEQLADD